MNKPLRRVHLAVTALSYNFPQPNRRSSDPKELFMATVAASPSTPAIPGASAVHEKFAKGPGLIGTLIFAVVAVGAVGYIGWNLTRDLSEMRTGSALPYILLGVALLVALAFEFCQRLP
jgi:hypothetical protein